VFFKSQVFGAQTLYQVVSSYINYLMHQYLCSRGGAVFIAVLLDNSIKPPVTLPQTRLQTLYRELR
jgi:hypothetical protein